MKLRNKLILSFLLLSVLPLSALVLYSYVSSTRSLRQAVQQENARLAGEMEERMTRVKEGVSQRLQELGAIPLGVLAEANSPEGVSWPELLGQVGTAVGGLAPLVESLELIPAAPAEAASGEIGLAEAPPAPEAPAPDRFVVWLDRAAEEKATAEERAAAREEVAAEAQEVTLAVATQVLDQVLDHLAAEVPPLPGGEAAPPPTEPTEGVPPATAPTAGAGVAREVARIAAQGLKMRLEIERSVREHRQMARAELEALETSRKENERLLGREISCPVEVGGEKIGQLRAQINARQVLTAVLSTTRRDRGEIPFAIDSEGQLYTLGDEDEARLQGLPLTAESDLSIPRDDWVVVRLQDEESGLVYGIARPIEGSLAELRRTAGRNFATGLGVVALALVGIAPLSRRITRDLSDLTRGAGELAAGNLEARVPVRSRDEVGHLATAFNQMAAELEENQERLLEQERLRKEDELRRRLLEADNHRKGRELEEARRFQLSLLPRRIPDHPELEIAVFMRTATEVGGDYYDFQLAPDGGLTVALGDATGHGARAGTMVTVLKSLFTAQAGEAELPAFLAAAAHTIRCMELGRMAMALTLARIRGRELRLAAAGMPPALLFRAAGGEVEEISAPGVPLGALAEPTYEERTARLAPGDLVLLMSDGLPELPDAGGEPLGYSRTREAFRAAAAAHPAPQAIIDALAQAASAWKGEGPPDDDMTFVALKVR